MKNMFVSVFFIFILFLRSSAQPYHYPFNYNLSELNRIKDAFFYELEKDLGRTILYDNTSPEYTYIQHLKNKSEFLSIGKPKAELEEREYYLQLYEIINKFPTQTSGYYNLAILYLKEGKVKEAIEVLRKATLVFNIMPESFSYLTQLYAENDEFIKRYNNLIECYIKSDATVFSDSSWIALYDSIREQDQLYRGRFRLNDPRFEPQYQIDQQNALFLRDLVLEYGWFSKFLGRNYNFVHVPVMHFSIEHQLFFLEYIIADCMSYQARWFEAEQVLWKMINHTTQVFIEGESYHSLPLLYIDPEKGIIDLERSMLAIRSAVMAMFGCGGNRSDIWLIATSELSGLNHIESLKVIKKYFVLLGLDEDKVHIQENLLESEIEDQLKYKTPVVLKRLS